MKYIQLLVFVLLVNFSFSQENLSLSNAIKTGLENNYQISIFKKDLEVVKNNNTWGSVGILPNISTGLSQMYRVDKESQNDGKTNRLSGNLTMQWTLFDGFGMQINKKKLENLEIITEGNVNIIIENTIKDIISAYYKCLLENEKLKIVTEVQELSKDRYNYMQTKQKFGSAVTYDVLQAKNAYLSDSSNVLLQKINFKNSLRNLNLLIGESNSIDYNLTEKFEISLKNYEFNSLFRKLLNQNKSLKSKLLSLNNVNYDIDLQKSKYLPTISLNSGLDFNSTRFNPDNEQFPTTTSKPYDAYLQLSLNFNIFNGGNRKKAINNAIIQKDIADLEVNELRHQLKNSLSMLHENYNLRKELYKVSEERLKSTKLNMQISEEKYKAGAINSFNYRDIQVLYLNSAFDRLQSIYNVIDAETELLKSVGEIVK